MTRNVRVAVTASSGSIRLFIIDASRPVLIDDEGEHFVIHGGLALIHRDNIRVIKKDL